MLFLDNVQNPSSYNTVSQHISYFNQVHGSQNPSITPYLIFLLIILLPITVVVIGTSTKLIFEWRSESGQKQWYEKKMCCITVQSVLVRKQVIFILETKIGCFLLGCGTKKKLFSPTALSSKTIFLEGVNLVKFLKEN